MFPARHTDGLLSVNTSLYDDENFRPRPPVRTYSKSADGNTTTFGRYFPETLLSDELHSPATALARRNHDHRERDVRVSSIAAAVRHCSEVLNACATSCRKPGSQVATDAQKHDLAELHTQICDIDFKLQIWVFEIGIDDTAEKILASSYELDLVLSILNRMQRRAEELERLCKGSPSDVLPSTRPERPADEDYGDVEDLDLGDDDATNSDAGSFFEFDQPADLEAILSGLETQTRSLSRCSNRVRQLLFPEHPAFEDRSVLLDELAQYFGSEDAVKRYKVDLSRYSGKAALEEARAVAKDLGLSNKESGRGRSSSNTLRPPEGVTGSRRRGKSDVASKPESAWPQRRALPYRDDLEHLGDILGEANKQKRR